MRSRAFFVGVFAVAATAAQPIAAAEPSGQAVAVVQDAAASGTGGARVLQVNGAIFAGDVIKTDGRGSAQVMFADNTRMVIGPNSQVTLDDFVFKSSTTVSKFSIDALRGSFRFITGASAKTAYSINTPTATIGVRGTQFEGHVADDGTTTVALWEGAVTICRAGGGRPECQLVSGTCSMVVLPPKDDFRRINNVYQRSQTIEDLFPFAFRQGWLKADFRVSSGGCEVHNFDPSPSPSGGDSPSAAPAPTPPPPPTNNYRTP